MFYFIFFHFARRLLFVTEISFLGLYEIDWEIPYQEIQGQPIIKANTQQIEILTKVSEGRKSKQKINKYLE